MKIQDNISITHMRSNSQRLDSWIAILDGEVIGHVYMDREPNKCIKFLDAWVHPDHRRKGIYRALWNYRWKHVQTHYPGYTVYAWCKPSSRPLYESEGFQSHETATRMQKKV